MQAAAKKPEKNKPPAKHAFRTAVLRGLGVVFPPLLTILIFGWVLNATYQYVLSPVTTGAREAIVWVAKDIRIEPDRVEPDGSEATFTEDEQEYHQVGKTNSFVPAEVYSVVEARPGDPPPETALGVYRRYVDLTWLRPELAIPFFLALLIIVLYLLGKFIAAGIGRFFWGHFERIIHQLPLVRNVYSSVKQVSDFLFTEREIEYTRVVAVEYPRKGIWSLGLVTGEGLLEIAGMANEPIVSLLIPSSPMPVTGYTITVKKSDTIDLDITIDQAFQFVISCGVVIPPQQLQSLAAEEPALTTDQP